MRKNLNKLATLALSGMMVMSMAMPALAKDITFKKVLYTDGYTLAPQTSFDFEIKPATGGYEWNYIGTDNKPYKANIVNGLPGGVVVKQPAVFEPDENNLGSDPAFDATGKKIGAQFESNATFEIKEKVFKDAPYGVYVYDLKEVDSKYEGIQYAESEFKLYVFKTNENGVATYTYSIERVKDGKGNAVHQKPEFISNNYGRHTPPETPDTPGNNPKVPNNSTHDVVIKKNISGTVGNKSEVFKFKVQVIPADTTAVTPNKKEAYYVESVGGATLGFKSLKADAESSEFSVTQDQGIHIYGLTKGDKVVVTEGSNSYVMTVAAEAGKESLITGLNSNSAGFTGDFKVIEDDAVVIVNNNKDQVTPTGIVMNVAPYAMMLAVAGGLGVVFMNRKKEEE